MSMWKLADRIGLEPLLVRFVAFDFRQSRKAMGHGAAGSDAARSALGAGSSAHGGNRPGAFAGETQR
jgi:hypothetical protein